MRMLLAVLMALVIFGSPAPAAGGRSVDQQRRAVKLGTFEIAGEQRIGIVLRDTLVVELVGANRALQRDPRIRQSRCRRRWCDLIGRYEYGMKTRLYEMVNSVVRGNRLTGAQRPAYVHA